MKVTVKRPGIATLASLLVIGLVSCSKAPAPPRESGTPSEPPPKPTVSVTVVASPSAATLASGSEVVLSPALEGVANPVFEWSVTGAGVLSSPKGAPSAMVRLDNSTPNPAGVAATLTVRHDGGTSVASWTATVEPGATAPPPPDAGTLVAPPAGTTCVIASPPAKLRHRQTLRGHCSGFPNDQYLWLIVKVGRRYHPQSAGDNKAICGPELDRESCNGAFTATGYFDRGPEAGVNEPFQFFLLQAHDSANREIHEYLKAAARRRDWPGIGRLPAHSERIGPTYEGIRIKGD